MKKQTKRTTKINLNVAPETRGAMSVKRAKKHAENKKTLTDVIMSFVVGGRSVVPKPELDSIQLRNQRATFDKYAAWLEKHPSVYEKVYLRVIKQLSVTKTDDVIMQACIIRNLPGLTEEQSRIASAQAIYNLSVAGVLHSRLAEGADSVKYHKISLGNKLPDVGMEGKRVQRKTAKQASRLVLKSVSSKVKRNNRNGLYVFKKNSASTAIDAALKLQSQKLRLYIPEEMNYESIATDIFKLEPIDMWGNVNYLYYELIDELKKNNGKTFYVEKTIDRALRIYGFKWLDITAPSSFRPYLRLSRKLRTTKAGLKAYREFLEEERDSLPQWFVEELEALKVGDYTNIMLEVDANNQGPAIIAAAMRDKHWFNLYWGSEDAPKMYQVFLESLMDFLKLPHDTLDVKDVKYKIMTKAYNKADKSNVFGDKDFLEKLEAEYLPGLFLAQQEFHNLPLKIQLQQKLGDKYKFEDNELLLAYEKAIRKTAPFLSAFAEAIQKLQYSLKVRPSIYEWENPNGDIVMSARSRTSICDIKYYGTSGYEHSIKYAFKELIPVNNRGGETALSPTWVASADAFIAHGIILDFKYDLFANHDAFFAHGNHKEDIQNRYISLYAMVPEYADKWFLGIQDTYYSDLPRMTLSEMVGNTGSKRLTDDEIFASTNLIG